MCIIKKTKANMIIEEWNMGTVCFTIFKKISLEELHEDSVALGLENCKQKVLK